jgi:hypothetical protein
VNAEPTFEDAPDVALSTAFWANEKHKHALSALDRMA